MEEMKNKEISQFTQVSGIDNAMFLLVTNGGAGAKAAPGTVVSALTASMRPKIIDGKWFIGGEDQGVTAIGKSPYLKRSGTQIVWVYEGETSEHAVSDLRDLVFEFNKLTPEERESLALKYDQLTPEEIADLQRPAREMISILEATNNNANEEEANRVANENVRKSQEADRQKNTATAITNAENATEDAKNATDTANEVASHPTYVGTDHYIYEYDIDAHQYVKTEKMVKAAAFKIDEIYSSMEDLLDNQPTGKMDGLFAIINTQNTEDEDNAKLFISKDGAWQYVVDMSGFRGFRGYVPQLFKGDVILGSNKDDADFILTETGKDDEGNPKYKVDFKLPTFVYSDFTEEQILELQKPAIDKAAEVQAEEDKRVIAENERKSAEEERLSSETTRKSNEETRISNEETRVSNENERLSNEEERKTSESARKTNEETRIANENERKSSEETRKTNEKVRIINEETRKTDEATRKTNEQTRLDNEAKRDESEAIRKENETTRQAQEEARMKEEERRVLEVDSLIKVLESFDVTIYEERLRYMEKNATCIGDVFGEEDEVDESLFNA